MVKSWTDISIREDGGIFTIDTLSWRYHHFRWYNLLLKIVSSLVLGDGAFCDLFLQVDLNFQNPNLLNLHTFSFCRAISENVFLALNLFQVMFLIRKLKSDLETGIFNERKLVLEPLNSLKFKVKVKVTMKKFRNSSLSPELLDDFW